MFSLKNTLITLSAISLALIANQSEAAKRSKKPIFVESTVELPIKPTHSVMALDLLQREGKELVTFGIDENKQHWLVIYYYDQQKNQYVFGEKHTLSAGFHSYDITEFKEGQLQKLYFLSGDELFVYKNQKDKLKPAITPIAKISSMSRPYKQQYLQYSDFAKDINDDNISDVVISDFSNTHLFIGQETGEFKIAELPIKPIVEVNSESTSYKKKNIYIADINMDKKADLSVVENGKLEVYYQTESGGFSEQPNYHNLQEGISGTDWWDQKALDGERIDQSKLVYKRIEHLKDVNNDGVTDMIVRYTQSSGVLDRANDYEVYLGSNEAGVLTFPDKASSVISAEGTLTGLEFIDIDNDDKLEVLLAGFDIGLSQIIGALMSGSIDQDVYIFKMDQNSLFNQEIKTEKEVELSFSLSSGTSGSPVVELADINGDGLKDLVLSDGEDGLKVYQGKEDKKLFSNKSKKYKIPLPKEGGVFVADDLNGDGKDDLMFKYGSQDGEELKRVIKVLFAS